MATANPQLDNKTLSKMQTQAIKDTSLQQWAENN